MRQAVDKANATAGANAINVPAGTYTLSLGGLSITNTTGTTIMGADPVSTFVQGGVSLAAATDRVFSVGAGASASISNFTIRFGQAQGGGSGGGILDLGTLALNNDVVTQNASGSTGATGAGGGGVDVEGSATISNSTISSNSSGPNRGGGVRFGAVSAMSSLTITGSVITGNSGTTSSNGNAGGGVATESPGSVTITGSTITANQAKDGGGLVEESAGTLNITGTTISGNTSSSLGGGVSEEGVGAINITQSTIHGNTSSGEGGGITQQGAGPVAVIQSTIDGNTASFGGAIAEEGGDPSTAPAFTLTNDTITGNHAVGSPTTSFGGGGLAVLGGGTAAIVNSTITDNTTTFGQGGNIQDDGVDPVDLTNTILSGGSPANCQGGDIFSSGTHGKGTAQGHNVAGDSSCSLGAPGDQFPVNPLLGALANNGGPTLTQALLAGSPAIDTGNSSACPATDQRGVTRTLDPCDIGAFEAQGAPPPPPQETPPGPCGLCLAGETQITSGPSGFTSSAPRFTFISNFAGATFECRFDAETFQPCTTPYVRYGLAYGQHTFHVRAIPPGGVPDTVGDQRTFTLGPEVRPFSCSINVADAAPAKGAIAGEAKCSVQGTCPPLSECMVVSRSIDLDNVQNASGFVELVDTDYGSPTGCGINAPGFIGARCPLTRDTRPFLPPPFGGRFKATCTLSLFFLPNSSGTVICTTGVQIIPVVPLVFPGQIGMTPVLFVPGAGTLTLNALTGVARAAALHSARATSLIAPVRLRTSGPGFVSVPLRLSKQARATLLRQHKLALRLRVQFTPTTGARTTRTQAVTVRMLPCRPPPPKPRDVLHPGARKKRPACKARL